MQKSHGEAPKGVVLLEIKISNMYPKKRFLVNGTYNSFNLRVYETKCPNAEHQAGLCVDTWSGDLQRLVD